MAIALLLLCVPAAAQAPTPGDTVARAHATLREGDAAGAVALFQQALRELPPQAATGLRGSAWLGLAAARLQTGEVAAAREAAEAVLGLEVEDAMRGAAHHITVLCAAMVSDHPQTIASADRALAALTQPGMANPFSEAQIRYLRAAALAAQARLPEAVAAQRAALDHALREFGDSAAQTRLALDTLAHYLEQTGGDAEALALLRRLSAAQRAAGDVADGDTARIAARIALLEERLAATGAGGTPGTGNALIHALRAAPDPRAARNALATTLASYGADHPLTAQARVNLGLALALADVDAARDELTRAHRSYRDRLGPSHLQTLQVLRQLARLDAQDPARLGDPALHRRGSERMHEALAGFSRMLGDAHPETLELLADLYEHHMSDGDRAHALALRAYRGLATLEEQLLPHLGAAARRALRRRHARLVDNLFYATWARMRRLRDAAGDVLVAGLAGSEEERARAQQEARRLQQDAATATAELFAAWITRKGQISAAENSLRLALRRTRDPVLASALRETLDARAELARLQHALGKDPARWDSQRRRITALREHIARNRDRLVQAFPTFHLDGDVSVPALAGTLPEGTLYLDFARLSSNEYFVFTLDHGAITLTRLVPGLEGEDTVDQRVRALRRLLNSMLDGRARGARATRRLEQLSRQLYADLLLPLRDRLLRHDTLIVAPDGLLGLLPFGLLQDERSGKHLAETHVLHTIPSARELLRTGRSPATSGSDVVVMADPEFGAAPVAPGYDCAKAGNSRAASLLLAFDDACIPRLPGTAREAEHIAARLGDSVTVLHGRAASESALASRPRPRILHLATHGFFLQDPDIVNPLERSGLLLSGAAGALARGLAQTTPDDGVVTGMELAALDLTGTRLVVLSACETGLGDVQLGEGIAGLNQALIRAGARGVIMSLWRVSDTATAWLMDRLYGALARGAAPAAALAVAQREMRATGHPATAWAAFVYGGR
jgi:CHAT domain-containing protein